jgi:hypothetical protein
LILYLRIHPIPSTLIAQEGRFINGDRRILFNRKGTEIKNLELKNVETI